MLEMLQRKDFRETNKPSLYLIFGGVFVQLRTQVKKSDIADGNCISESQKTHILVYISLHVNPGGFWDIKCTLSKYFSNENWWNFVCAFKWMLGLFRSTTNCLSSVHYKMFLSVPH